MTDGFRVKGRFAAALIAASSLLVTPALAADIQLAQDGPVRLMPRRDLSNPVPQSQPSQPSQPSEGAAPGAPEQETQPLPEIQVKDLGSVDPEAVGTLDAASGGFSANMWLGTPRSTIERLIGSVPAEIRSPVMRGLAERLLLTAAALPPADPASSGEKATRSILSLRVERLQAMGLVDAARALIEASPTRARDPELIRLYVENLLLANDLGGACAETKRDAANLVSHFWQRMTIFCQLLAGDNDGAQFGANVLAESPDAADKPFLTIVDMMEQKRPARLDSLPSPTPLDLAMLRSMNAPLPADVVDKAAPPILRAIGISPNADLDLRLHAAERAALVGAIDIKRLAQIYMSIEFSENELNNALSTAEKNWTPRGRALLYRAARMQTVPTAKAAVVQKAFELGRRDGHLLLLVRLYRDILKGIPVSADLAWFAGEAAKGLLALGEKDAARPWVTLLRERELRDEDARKARDRLWALAIMAGDDRYRVDDMESMSAWLNVLREEEPDLAYERAGLALVLMQAIGVQVPANYWQTLLQPPRRSPVLVPPPAFIPALEEAVRGGRLGESVLISILTLGPDGTLGADASLLRDVIVALRTSGLETEGRTLALEAAFVNGL
jgi:hypothetical protein